MKNNSSKFIKKIVAGKYKGKTLYIPSKTTTRSSKVVVLESFFNTIQFDVIDCIFVEVFSGSGSIGLEALSRGAKEIFFMERDRDALVILQKNISSLQTQSCRVIHGDSFANIQQISKELQNTKKRAFFYIDPPFDIRDGMENIYKKTLKLIENLPQEIVQMIIVEHISNLKLPKEIASFTTLKSKKFGKTTLTYFVHLQEEV